MPQNASMPRGWPGPLLGLLLLAAAPRSQERVHPPPGWVAGDAHEFFPACDVPAFDPDARALEILERMFREGLDVVAAQLWIDGNVTCESYLARDADLVDGCEHPVTRDDPFHVLQIGVEVAVKEPEPCQVDRWGHVLALGVSDGRWDQEVDYPAPTLDFLRAQPGSLVGYAHVFWPVGPEPPPINMDMTRFYPLLAPFDAVLGRLELLGATDVDGGDVDDERVDPWYGLYYRLSNLGLPLAVAAGSVGRCYRGMCGDSRTWVRLDGPLDFPGFVRGIAEGRVTLADGAEDFLDLFVNGRPLGTVLELDSADGPPTLDVEAELRVALGVPRTTRLEIVMDGEVVAAEDVDLPAGGTHVLTARLPVSRSGWVAARLAEPMRAHTAAVRFLVDGRPPVDPATAGSFVDYADLLLDLIDELVRVCERCGDCPTCLRKEQWLGSSEEEIRAYIARGRRAFQVLASLDRSSPGVTRTGRGRGGRPAPFAVLPEGPARPGEDLDVACAFAPPGAPPLLVAALDAGPPGLLGLGACGGAAVAGLLPLPGEGFVREARLPCAPLVGVPLRLRWILFTGEESPAASDELRLRLP